MKRWLLALLGLMSLTATAQEVLLPLWHAEPTAVKSQVVMTLPLLEDFSTADCTERWEFIGALYNNCYAPLPPTVGMATLDAYDAEGRLYPNTLGVKTPGDTLLSPIVRLDSVFQPYPHRLTIDDSLYLSFYYTPGGGYGNMWERMGDSPEMGDSLLLQFYVADSGKWETVWSTDGTTPEELYGLTGTYWQQVSIHIAAERYLRAGFRLRFINYCSLDQVRATGVLANADQWNLDYIYLNTGRSVKDTAYRDIAFVNPPQSLLRHYQAMPAKQFVPTEMRDTLAVTITNLYGEELACGYGYEILDEHGLELHRYDGGWDNIVPYMPGMRYQTSAVHARPPLEYVLPVVGETSFTVCHHLHEGVEGTTTLDALRTYNDTVRRQQIFDNYYAYDDGSAENGYGLVSTMNVMFLACRYELNAEDTLTSVELCFNRSYQDETATIPFLLTVWNDKDGMPGEMIYQDNATRRPRFDGLNEYVRYVLEQPTVCSGTIYVGLQQNNNRYINLGFDRNNDASTQIVYRTSPEWQTSILRGALMLRPYFGSRGALAVLETEHSESVRAYGGRGTLQIENPQGLDVTVYNTLGQQIGSMGTEKRGCLTLQLGVYIVTAPKAKPLKVIVY